MLGLDSQQMRMALGIAASRAETVSANTGTMTKSTHCGNAGRMGMEAALLAEKGFTANATPTCSSTRQDMPPYCSETGSNLRRVHGISAIPIG